MPLIPESPDVSEADRLRCRTLIEAASFHAVDYEEDGAAWERVLPEGECLVLAVWESALFGKPERPEWTLVRFMKDGRLGEYCGPSTLDEALVRAAAYAVLPLFSPPEP